MEKQENIEKIKEASTPIMTKYGVKRAGVFGSFARGDYKAESDIDIVIEFDSGKTLFDLIRLRNELQNQLNRAVDIITYNSIHPFLREEIFKNQITIL